MHDTSLSTMQCAVPGVCLPHIWARGKELGLRWNDLLLVTVGRGQDSEAHWGRCIRRGVSGHLCHLWKRRCQMAQGGTALFVPVAHAVLICTVGHTAQHISTVTPHNLLCVGDAAL